MVTSQFYTHLDKVSHIISRIYSNYCREFGSLLVTRFWNSDQNHNYQPSTLEFTNSRIQSLHTFVSLVRGLLHQWNVGLSSLLTNLSPMLCHLDALNHMICLSFLHCLFLNNYDLELNPHERELAEMLLIWWYHPNTFFNGSILNVKTSGALTPAIHFYCIL